MTHRLRTAFLSPALMLLVASALPHQARAIEASVPEDDGAYATGTRAMNEHRWADAVASFDRVVDGKGKRADAALYWKAYSLNKLGKGPLALATCYQLRSHYASSSWNKDCSALSIDMRGDVKRLRVVTGPSVVTVDGVGSVDLGDLGALGDLGELGDLGDLGYVGSHGRDPNAELKILALNSLLNRDPAQAVPLLRGILTGNQPENVKQHAIFVLAQSKSPEAQGILHDAVVGKMGVDLQRKAIQMSGVFQGKKANDGLAEVYRTTSDRQIKKSIISAFFISQDAPRMVELARNEKDLDLKRSIVSQLALMNDKAATDYMLELLK